MSHSYLNSSCQQTQAVLGWHGLRVEKVQRLNLTTTIFNDFRAELLHCPLLCGLPDKPLSHS